jgi:oxygen-independent coproporphyrinogen III oxidase
MLKNRDFLFKLISKKIADSDFSGYTFQYPPLFSWKEKAAEEKVHSAWRKKMAKRNKYLGLYVHIPFCKTRCTYCRYFSKKLDNNKELNEFMVFLKKEIALLSPYFKKQKIHTLYIGGGTPSILSESQLKVFFDFLYKIFDFSQCQQVVFEGNPDLLTLAKLKLLKKYKVNRLTIGVQSLDQAVIELANRFQTSGSFQRCIRDAKQVGIETINVDLMVGLPQQSSASFLKTLEEVISFDPDMVHLHPFFPTNLTTFTKDNQKVSLQEIKKREKMSELGQLVLKKSGYNENDFDASSKGRKDINFQLSDAIEHNSSFLGLGPGAVSHVAGKLRYANSDSLEAYSEALKKNKLPILAACSLKLREDMIYYVTSCLRYSKVDKQKFSEIFGKNIDEIFAKEIAYLLKRKKIKNTAEFLLPNFKNLGEYTVFSKYFYAEKLVVSLEKEFFNNQGFLKNENVDADALFMDLI